MMILKGASEALGRNSDQSRGDREMSVGMMETEVNRLGKDLRAAQAEIDSSLAGLGLKSVNDLPTFNVPGKRIGGRGVLAAVVGFLTGRHPRPPAPAEITPKEKRRIEDVEIVISQAEGIRKRIDRYRVEIQKKFSIPFACIVFVLVGAPLGMRARRGGLTVGFVSVVFFLFYYLCLIGGEQLADRAIISPWLAMWLPNIVLGVLGARLTWRVARSGWTLAAARHKAAT
jgi:lipopolysaccharide export system permease protein